jgi:hypothetical protein
MTIGDPRKAKLMVIVAIGAIGFLVIELLPSPGEGQSKQVEGAPAKDAAKTGPGARWTVVRDPFSSVLLLKRPESPAPQPSGVPLQTAEAGRDARTSHRADLPSLPPSSFDLTPVAVPGTKELAGTDRAKIGGTETVLTLRATLKIDDRIAMISVGQAEAKEFRSGSQPVPGVRVASIDTDGVVLHCKGRDVRLAVGQEVKI